MKWKSDQDSQPRISPKDHILISTLKDNSIDQKTSSSETRNTDQHQTHIFEFSCLNAKIGFAQLQRTNLPIFLTTLGPTSSKVKRAHHKETHVEILINIQNKITCMI